MNHTLIIRTLGYVFSLILIMSAIYFIGQNLNQNWGLVRNGPEHLNRSYFIVAVILFQCYWFYQILLWRWILSGFGTHIEYLLASQFFFTSNMLAYIPGKIANVLGMAQLASHFGVSRAHIVTTMAFFQIYSLISGTAIIGILSFTLPLDLGSVIPTDWLWLMILASLIGLVFISPQLSRHTLALLRRLSGQKITNIILPFNLTLSHILAYGIGWLLLGSIVWCLFKGFGTVDQVLSVPAVIVVFIGSYLVGLLAIAVPAGIGITEAGIIYGLSALIPTQQALFGAVTFRLVAIITTIISYGIIIMIRRNHK